MAVDRLALVMAQLGPKPGARRALARVVTVNDLPGDGWRMQDERTWRTGASRPATEWGQRARAAGSVTAWRSFALVARRWCWVQVVPLASELDAVEALDGVEDRLLNNLRGKVTVSREHDVQIEPFPGADRVWAHEQHTDGPTGAGVARMLAATTGPYVVVVAGSGSPEWDWYEVSELGRRQAARLSEA